MRKEYGKVLRKDFGAMLKEIAPEFKEWNFKDSLLPGQRVYQWEVKDNIYCYIILLPSPKGGNNFTIELGWSKLGRFPELSCRPSTQFPSSTHDEFELPEYICRLGMLSEGNHDWWKIEESGWDIVKRGGVFNELVAHQMIIESLKPLSAEEAEARVLPKLEAAMKMLADYGIPYLRKYAEQIGN